MRQRFRIAKEIETEIRQVGFSKIAQADELSFWYTINNRGIPMATDVAFSLGCLIDTPLQKIEGTLYPLVSYFIIPLFALANAGVDVAEGTKAAFFMTPVTIGVVTGLLLGKPLGIVLFSWLAVKGRFALLPEEVSWAQICSVACLAGIGFTMSLFISNLAFVDPLLIQQSKIGILAGSTASALLGTAILWLGSLKSQR
ncbi:MAG TPA: hypothetical protein DCK87_08620 [Desulfotomaculum sp.]|nr:hypothetical protein [Desulfotomaculum sp.]